jgi:hypothetical protein
VHVTSSLPLRLSVKSASIEYLRVAFQTCFKIVTPWLPFVFHVCNNVARRWHVFSDGSCEHMRKQGIVAKRHRSSLLPDHGRDGCDLRTCAQTRSCPWRLVVIGKNRATVGDLPPPVKRH